MRPLHLCCCISEWGNKRSENKENLLQKKVSFVCSFVHQCIWLWINNGVQTSCLKVSWSPACDYETYWGFRPWVILQFSYHIQSDQWFGRPTYEHWSHQKNDWRNRWRYFNRYGLVQTFRYLSGINGYMTVQIICTSSFHTTDFKSKKKQRMEEAHQPCLKKYIEEVKQTGLTLVCFFPQ